MELIIFLVIAPLVISIILLMTLAISYIIELNLLFISTNIVPISLSSNISLF